MIRIDEVVNGSLADGTVELERFGYGDLVTELDRVEEVIEKHSLTGDDISYWVERSKILEQEIETRELDPRRDD